MRWQVRGGAGPVAMEQVRVAANETTALRLEPLQLTRWTVHLRGLPANLRGLFLRLQGSESLGGAAEGIFPFDFATPPRVGDAGIVRLPRIGASFPAMVAAVDIAQRRADLESALTSARWTQVTATSSAGGVASLALLPATGDDGQKAAIVGPEILVPLLPGASRLGCVLETIAGNREVTCWFRVAHGERSIAPAGSGRWGTVRILRPFAEARVSVASREHACPIEVRTLHEATDVRLFLADGTSTLHVDLRPGGRVSLPVDGTTIVVR